MADVVVTVPKTFRYGGKLGLAAWISEGAAAGDEPDPELDDERWSFTAFGPPPDINPGDRVYVVCESRLRGYSLLTDLDWEGKLFGAPKPTGKFPQSNWHRWAFIRGSAAEAVTIPDRIVGFRGWRARWWDRADEVPFPNWREP